MHAAFQKRFEHLQNLLNKYEQSVRGLTNEQLNQNPAEGSWSIAEIVHHISHAEKGITHYIQKKLDNPAEIKKAGLKSLYRAVLLRFALKSSRKFRAPKQLDEPKGPYHMEELMGEWRSIRNVLEETYNKVPETYIRYQLFKHPVVGKINLSQTLGFMGDHMQRHLEQIEEIKRAIK